MYDTIIRAAIEVVGILVIGGVVVAAIVWMLTLVTAQAAYWIAVRDRILRLQRYEVALHKIAKRSREGWSLTAEDMAEIAEKTLRTGESR